MDSKPPSNMIQRLLPFWKRSRKLNNYTFWNPSAIEKDGIEGIKNLNPKEVQFEGKSDGTEQPLEEELLDHYSKDGKEDQ